MSAATGKAALRLNSTIFSRTFPETIRAEDKAVLPFSIPASEGEMNAEDQGTTDASKAARPAGQSRHYVGRIGNVGDHSSPALRVGGLPDDGKKTVGEYADWVIEHRNQVPSLFPVDQARDVFAAAYPFHPMVCPSSSGSGKCCHGFSGPAGVLRLLALWVSRAYQEGYKGGHRDP